MKNNSSNFLLHHRRLCGLFFAIFFLLSYHSSVLSVETRQIPNYRIGFWYLPGYHEETTRGERNGYGYEYMEKIAACMGWRFQYVGYDKSWADLLTMLEKGEIDILSNATITPDRLQRFDYSNRPIGLSFTILTVKAGDNRYRPNDYANWNGMRVGMIRESSRNTQFDAFAKIKDFHFIRQIFPTYDELEDALKKGKVDALVSTSTRRTDNEWILEKINPDPLYIMVRKGNKELLDSINKALSLLEINAPRLNETLTSRYYLSESSANIPLTSDELLFIEQSKKKGIVFKALLKPDRWPLAAYCDGTIKGSMRDIANLMIKRSGLDIQIISCKNRAEYDAILKNREFDLIFDAWSNYPYAEKNDLYLSEPYLSSSVSLLQLKRRDKNTNKKAVFRNSWLVKELSFKGIDISSFVFCDTTDEMISAVLNGSVDGAYLHTRMANEVVYRDKSMFLASQLVYGLQTDYAVGFKRSLPPEMVRIVSKAVRSITEDDIQQISSNYELEPRSVVSISDWLMSNPIKSIVATASILITIIVLLVLLLLSQRRLYRRGKILEKLPLRFFVADKAYNVLFYYAPDAPKCMPNWKNISEYSVPDVVEAMKSGVSRAFADGTCSVDFISGGQHRTARVERLDNSIFGCDAVVWISQNTEELQASRKQLQIAVEQARAAEKAKSYFLATMSHEIRTPLNAVIGFAELLKDSKLSIGEQADYLNDISSAGNALLALINDVLDLSKLEAGQMNFVASEIDFVQLLREIIAVFQPHCRNKSIDLVLECAPMPHVFLDHLRIRQILFNLLGNAVKFTETGSITLHTDFHQEDDVKTGTLIVSVADTGIGISEEDQKTLFQPFVQSKSIRGTKTANNGTGLGLVIVRRMVNKMGGEITLESAPGKGAKFTVLLHHVLCGENISEAEGQELSSSERPLHNEISKRFILLVDDVAMNLKVEAAMLNKLGMSVVLAENAEQAIKRLKEQKFDYVLTDLWMPGLNGMELARLIRRERQYDTMSVIAVTADAESQVDFDMTVFDQILTKPVTVEKLSHLLHSPERRLK